MEFTIALMSLHLRFGVVQVSLQWRQGVFDGANEFALALVGLQGRQ